jgi:hypothetical protein
MPANIVWLDEIYVAADMKERVTNGPRRPFEGEKTGLDYPVYLSRILGCRRDASEL